MKIVWDEPQAREKGGLRMNNADQSSIADRAAVDDNPEWTDEELASAQSLAAFAPELAAAIEQGRNADESAATMVVSLVLDRAVVDRFQAESPNWRSNMGEALRKAVGL